ncbi:helix-turn-helix domain-containing protein [Glutamicibacter arilaitensis]|uniref:helix-turn-helix domain-containing protein n=1 Tax=Glutamicibacter arilaitensis TaxID=256701 RepID=UPI00384D69E2
MAYTTGDRIKNYRVQAEISQRDLESRTELSQSTIARIESGDRIVKPYELAAIAHALGCPESSLMESDPIRDRVQFAARTSVDAKPNTQQVKDHLLYLLEMDNYLTRALALSITK